MKLPRIGGTRLLGPHLPSTRRRSAGGGGT
jgi:hypothetical protein